MKARANELKAQGRTIVDLSTGEPDIDTPEHIKVAATKALMEGKTKYTPVQGIPELREAIAQKLSSENGIPTKPGQVIVTNVGIVYDGPDKRDAMAAWNSYKSDSHRKVGRAANERVCVMCDHHLYRDFDPRETEDA